VTAIKEPREKAWGKDQRRTPSGRKATFRPDGQQDEDGEPVKADPALGEFKAEDAKRAKTLLFCRRRRGCGDGVARPSATEAGDRGEHGQRKASAKGGTALGLPERKA
jgi:hypothetical protein